MSLTISNPLFISSLIHTTKTLNFSPQNPFSTSNVSSRAIPIPLLSSKNAAFPFNKKRFNQNPPFACFSSTVPTSTKNYEFSDDPSDMELRIQLGGIEIQNPRDVYVDVEDSSLTIRVKSSPTIRVKSSPSMVTLMETKSLFDRIKPSGTIWYVDDDQLVINLKKQDPDMKWPNIVESWESLAAGSMQFLKGTSIYNVDDLTEINQKVARELAVGLGY